MNRTWCRRLNLLAAGLLASAGMAAPVLADDGQNPHQQPVLTELDPDMKIAEGSVKSRNQRVPNAGTNATCQQNANFILAIASANITGFGVTGSATSTTGSIRMDNFRVAGTGAQLLNRVTWSGWLETGASPSIALVSPATQNFIISVYDNVNGAPAAAPLAGFPVTVSGATSTLSFVNNPTDTVPSGNPTGTFAVTDFSAILPDTTLTGGNCYWIEIRPEPASFNTLNRYFWRPSDQGDGAHMRRTPAGANIAPGARGVSLGDFAFCVGGVGTNPVTTVSTANGLQCPIGTAMPCGATPTVAGCHSWDAVGNAFNSSGNFSVADNFTITAPATITNVCWQGVYSGTAPVITTGETFEISIFPDSGGANAGVPNTAAPVAVVTADATGSGGAAGATLTGVANANVFTFTTSSNRAYTAALGTPINLTPGCYWIQVRNTTAGAGSTFGWFWLVKGNARAQTPADGFNQQRQAPVVYSVATQIFNADATWCLQGAQLVRSTTCLPAPAAVNRTCGTATLLVAGGPTLFSNTIREVPPTAIIPPPVGLVSPSAYGNWYRLVGTGNSVTVSTCNSGTNPAAANTDFDSTIAVYCPKTAAPNECNGPFVGIASNDDAAPACGVNADASSVTFPTVAGQNYYIYVSGTTAANGVDARGFFYINAVNGAASPTAVTCANSSVCVITLPPAGISTPEGEACGERGPNGASCDTAVSLALGNWGVGTLEGSGGARDQDIWQLPPPIDTAGGGQWYSVQIRTETPMVFIIFPNPCAAGTLGTGTGLTLQTCAAGELSFNVWVPVNAEPGLFVITRNLGFDAPLCDSVNRGNRYAFRMTLAPTGACCAVGSACTTSVATNELEFFTGAPVSCDATVGGVYQGDGTTCSPTPCETDSNSPNFGGSLGTLGTCCGADGTCLLGASFGATNTCVSGTTFNAATTCTPAGCVDTSVECCLPTGVCTIVPPAACVGGVVGTRTTCIPNACPQPALGGCCDIIGQCFLTFSFDCPTGGGVTFNPAITSCSPNTCPVAGSCCNGITCTFVVQSACTGTWTTGQICTPNPCDPSGACCNGTSCTITTQSTCTGTWQGANTTCAPTNPCAPATVICCRGSTCSIVASAACTTTGFAAGSSNLAGTTCNASGNNTSPCCHANYNKVDGVTVPDIFAFLGDWFANSPFAFVGGDGTGVGSPGVPAIFAFLGAWFAGCP